MHCGRCCQPICTRCAVEGQSACAAATAPGSGWQPRPRAVLHGASKPSAPGRGARRVVWYLALWHLLLSLFNGFFGGHRDG